MAVPSPLEVKPVQRNRKVGRILLGIILALLFGSIYYIIIFPSLK